MSLPATAIILLLLLLAGRLVSLAVYQMTWRNGASGNSLRPGALVTMLLRPQWWPLHALLIWPVAGMSWDGMPGLRIFATAAAAMLALGTVGRMGVDSRGRFFALDRVLASALALCVPLDPGFLYPCVVACCCLSYTVASWPLGPGYSNLLGHEFIRGSLCVLCASLAIAGGTSSINEAMILAALAGYQATGYVHHALAKCALGPSWHSWIRENRAQCLVANAWLRGWNFLRSERRALAFAAWVGRHRQAICAMGWGIEFGWILFLADARFAMALLVVTLVFHGMVFALTGLLAWHYMANHLLWLVLIGQGMTDGLFSSGHWLGYLIALPLSALWVGRVRTGMLAGFRRNGNPGAWGVFGDAADHLMAWWDTPLMRMFSYTVKTTSGREYALPVPKLAPYDTMLTDIHTHLMILGRHHGLDPELAADRELAATGVWGLTISREVRDFLYQAMDGKQPLPSAWSENSSSPPASPAPDGAVCLRDLLQAMNRHAGAKWYRLMMRWPHFPGEDLAPDICPLSGPRMPVFGFDEAIESVTLWRLRTFYSGNKIYLLNRAPVWTIRAGQDMS